MGRYKAGMSVAAVGLMVLVSCGGSDKGSGGGAATSAEAPYVDALMSTFEKDETIPLEESQVRCLAEGVVKVIVWTVLRRPA